MNISKKILFCGLFLSRIALGQAPAPLDPPPTPPTPIAEGDSQGQIDGSLGDFKPEGRPSQTPHPDFGGGIGNRPSRDWYNDMYEQLYYMKDASYQLKKWGYSYHQPKISYYANWLYESLGRYTDYTYSYDSYGHYAPRHYSKFNYYPTRGDHNYYYYYYVRPIYYQILREAKHYYQTSFDPYYAPRFKYLAARYHSYARCNYGVNGQDMKARNDTDSLSFEKEAGLL